jgi:ribosomal protein S18 acetylase RimI-like enzyme
MVKSTIRKALEDDVPGIATVHVESWQSTYRGIMPDDVLDNLSLESRMEQWRMAITNPRSPTFVYVAVDSKGVLGFASGGPLQTKMTGFDGELYAIYLLEAYQRKGIGTALFTTVAQHFLAEDVFRMVLWVLMDNKGSRGFYEKMGGKKAGTKPYQVGKEILTAVAYGYNDLRSFSPDKNSG